MSRLVEGMNVAPVLSEKVPVPRTVEVYPQDSDEARHMIDKLRDEKRQWMLTAKILFDQVQTLTGLLAAEKRKHAKG